MNALTNEKREYYDGSFPLINVLAPLFWFCVVWGLLLGALVAVGYAAGDKPPSAIASLVADLDSMKIDFAARRAALAFSGVTLAITMALALTSLFWCGMSWVKKSDPFRCRVLVSVAPILGLLTWASWYAAKKRSFTSELGQKLLELGPAQLLDAPLAQCVPFTMFALACVVPSLLVAGATALLQPVGRWTNGTDIRRQIQLLRKRLHEIDQMLYVGALALVFGTLQLSSGLSVALFSMPKAADLKARSDLCKTMAPSSTASSPFFATPPSQAGSASAQKANSKPRKATAPSSTASSPFSAAPSPAKFNERCQELPALVLKLDSADSLRQLVRGVTICFGLAFSALLVSIYVPTLIVLTGMLEPRQNASAPNGASGAAESDTAAAIEPFSRLAALVATLSPLFAGLLANTLASG